MAKVGEGQTLLAVHVKLAISGSSMSVWHVGLVRIRRNGAWIPVPHVKTGNIPNSPMQARHALDAQQERLVSDKEMKRHV